VPADAGRPLGCFSVRIGPARLHSAFARVSCPCLMNSSPHLKSFLIALAVLTVFHAISSFAAYRIFTVRRDLPVDSSVTETTTPAERAAGESSFRMMTGRSETITPMPVTLYIMGGFIGLVIAAIVGAITYFRGG